MVSDNGPGIDPKIINRLFDPYFTSRGLCNSSGMGLAVVHTILFVDDEEFITEMAGEAMTQLGYQVEAMSNPKLHWPYEKS